MASYDDLDFEWSLLCKENECAAWTENDLQLAAELGKTLLERNKELEGTIKNQQNIIDDQLQEIEYLTKQNNALREVNDTRLKIYENIEISIQDLEKQNHRLNVDNSGVKKINKTLTTTNETLEEKCEELRKQIEELHREVEIERRKNERLQIEQRTKKDETVTAPTNICSRQPDSNKNMSSTSQIDVVVAHAMTSDSQAMGIDEVDRRLAETCDNEEIMNIITELDGTKRQLNAERQRVSELEDQLSSLIQDNRELQNRVAQSVASDIGEMRSMHDELAILEESGQGKMCRRCLRGFDDDTLTVPDYASSIACTEDGDDASLNELLQQRTNSVQNIYNSQIITANQDVSNADSTLSAPSPNPYRDLVDKYEALLEVHNAAFRNRQDESTPTSSLHDELASGNSSSANTSKEASEPSPQNKENMTAAVTGAKRKLNLRTPTDFSEAETSSSGYSDEISNKCTQTEETFLCTIADGDDKFSIYDETSPIDSRFRHCPKYRHLFKEIFATLKKAAENKDEGEKLPLLDDTNPAFKVPPVTPAVEELPTFPEVEDTESVISSVVSEQSIAMSECVTKHERKTAKKKTGQENKTPTKKEVFENGRTLTPHKREPLEYLAFNNLRKKNKKRNRQGAIDPSDSPALIPTSPRFFYASNRKRRDRVAYDFPKDGSNANNADGAQGTSNNSDVVWNGNSITVYNRNMQTGRKTTATGETVVFRTKSAAAHDLHKLMKLDLSYAEVLRCADQTGKNKLNYRRK
ncbi:cerebellar degeneration-related protein 2 isoform X2 [Sitodiplosis mosellana]|uniref:cerebellar degeneration-related protein 2 isoform X2 n=1 Tax=Sitodiplosis mosellana TaxID=263140 RepID=UPI002444EC3B|nr:cerebellar degeneration-related protein 2 isoform X2 [Sitodiplosis mosellana]XP_055297107.1 cerebellar degeneration-related protein 2 isoform X2 [Sitodiplosis mosellana]XP_055297109.1 cerebellar degeneration-related protein 2 isoform X2 [Sitodiplosis mosellana]XP_055297110.1 cerebellar degeneration-related protein 2 isoform X2 [Sitodiplosis mosellana]XP_055297111.1 cerebellar degeneration-related protein 2 isoform X2 [Sitodiplosis mosellana]